MQAFTVLCINSFTGKTMKKNIQANTAPEAGVKAISNYMMANAWGVEKITDSAGAEHSQFVRYN